LSFAEKAGGDFPTIWVYAARPAAAWLEAGMTSEIGVERVGEQQFLFHCSCGATIETSQKREICPDCGETIEVIRCVPTPDGKKYTLRISKHKHGRSQEPLLWPLDSHPSNRWPRHQNKEESNEQLFHAVAATQPIRRYHYTPNY
jgi:predicted RNA-binding Zn-ribbon protein involved in translation (DUF1610 family)